MRLSILGLVMALIAVGASDAGAWSGGPLLNVTELDAKCAVCHSAVGKEQHQLESAGMATGEMVENKHYKKIETGSGAYQSMSPADRDTLLADVKIMDQHAAVDISVPAAVRPGQEVQISVSVTGGNALVGVALMDTDLKQQGRSIQADGWVIVGAPKVWGSDGKEQTKWIDRRGGDLRKNINSAVIFDQAADPAAKKFASGKATWTVKAPQEPGKYSVTAVMFYGTEKASPAGRVTTPTGAVVPKGGMFGPSGRVKFAKPVVVTVQ